MPSNKNAGSRFGGIGNVFVNAIVIGLAVLLPLVNWAPLGVIDLGRFLVLSIGVLMLSTVYFWRTSGEKSVPMAWSPALVLFIIALVAGGISSFFGLAPWTALTGDSGELMHGLFAAIILIVFAALFAQIVRTSPAVRSRLSPVISIALVVPLIASIAAAFAPTKLGSLQLALHVASVATLALALIVYAMIRVMREGGRTASVFAALAVIGFVGLLVSSVPMSWLILSGFALVALLGALIYPKYLAAPTRVAVPLVVLVAALFFAASPSPIKSPFASEVTLSPQASMRIVQSSVSHRGWFFGTGPASFGATYEYYKDGRINGTSYWSAVFPSANSELMTIVATWGPLAAALMVLGLFVIGWSAVYRRGEDVEAVPLEIVAVWLVLLVATGCFVSDFIVIWPLVVLTAIMAAYGSSVREWNLSKVRPGTTWVALRSALLIVLFWIALRATGMTVAFAMMNNIASATPEESVRMFDTAHRISSHSDLANRIMALAAVQKLGTVAADKADVVRSLVETAARSSGVSISTGEGQADNWRSRARVMTALVPFAADAQSEAIGAWREVAKLSPADPAARTEAALAILRSLDGQKDAGKNPLLEEAEKGLQEALALKADYLPATFGLALVDTIRGNNDKAEERLQGLLRIAPNDVGVLYQIGKLRFDQKHYSDALPMFDRARTLSPQFSNAHWFTALALDALGNRVGAMVALEKIQAYDPGNLLVKQKLAEWQKVSD